MSEDLAKYESALSNLDDNDLRIKMQNFQTILHKEPRKDEIKVNEQAKNSKYVPISHLEMKLDEMFFSLWSTKNFISSTVANELIGSIELWYFHPVAKTWLCRIGVGAVMVQYKKDTDIMDLGNKIKNTLTKDYPHLKAECFRNACLSIGKSFGRDLNREFDDQYSPVIKEAGNDIKTTIKKIIDALDAYNGSDKAKLKQECAEANANGTFDELFAEIMAKKIGLKL